MYNNETQTTNYNSESSDEATPSQNLNYDAINKINKYNTKAKITEFFTSISIIACLVAMYFFISSSDCSGMACSGPSWAIAATIGIGFIPFLVSLILLIKELISHHKMSQEEKNYKTVKVHTIAIYSLGAVLLLALATLIIVPNIIMRH